MIPYGRQSISEEDIASVVAVLRSDWLTQGPAVPAFEEGISKELGGAHCVAVCNATAALHLAMLVAGVRPGDRVVTSPITFLASANAAAFVGAVPDFCDIDPVSLTLDPEALERNWQEGTKAVVAVDYAGQAADLPAIARIAHERGAVVIEDACHGVGGGFFGPEDHPGPWKLGGNPWADIAAFSFHPVKTITSGEGGMLVTANAGFAEAARMLRSHGTVRDPGQFIGPADCPVTAEKGPWFYEMQELGFNYRLTDLQAALGLSQLSRLRQFLARRREIVASYNEAFAGLPGLQIPGLRDPRDAALASWHLYTVQVDFLGLEKSRTEVMGALREDGVGTQVLYIPVHLQPWYREQFGYGPGKCPVAEAFYRRALSLPLFPAMTDADVGSVIRAVRRLFQ